MCSLCYRFTLFSLVSRVIKPQAPSIRHIGSIYNRHWHPQEWKKGRELSCRRVGQSAIVRTSNLLSMANMACKPRLSSSTASGGPSTLHGTTRVKRVSIEGNIAVGKSTFVRMLQSANQDWQLVPEPVGKWQSIDGDGTKKTVSNLLQMMYQEPQRWSYTFQTYSCMGRLRAQLQPPPAELLSSEGTPVQVFERSIYSDRYIFALNMFELGCINSTEWAVYQEWHSFLVEQFGHQVELEGIIYLRAPPQKCMERLGCRGRIEEEGVQLDYLDKLHTQHEKWLIEKSTKLHFERLGQVPVLILDAGVEFEKDLEVQEKLITKVKTFFKML